MAKKNEELIKVFESYGIEKKFLIGEILLSKKVNPNCVFLIKEGNARLVIKINGKLTSVRKLSKGDTFGIASLLGGKCIENIRAAENLVVYVIEDKNFLDLYEKETSIKNYCDHNIWEAELISILENFPRIYQKDFLLDTDLLEQVSKKINLVNPNLKDYDYSIKKNKSIFYLNSTNNLEIWTEIKSVSEMEKILQIENELPIRIFSLPKNIDLLKLKKNYSKPAKKIDDKEISNPFITPYQSKDKNIKLTKNKSLVKSEKNPLEITLACFEMISNIMNFPFKKESTKNSLKEYLNQNKFLSLKVCAEIGSYHELQIDLSKVNLNMASRIRTPALIQWEDNFAVIVKSNRNFLEIFNPYKGLQKINFRDLKNLYPNGIEILNFEKTKFTQEKLFGLNWFYPFLKNYKSVLIQILIASFVIQFFTLANPLLIQVIIDKVISQRSLDTLQVLGIALLLITLLEGVLNSLKSFLLSDTSNRIDKRISNDVIDHLLGLPLNFFEKRRTGELSSRISELEKIRNFLTSQIMSTLLDGAFSIIYIIVMFAYSIKLTLISLIVLPIQIFITFIGGPLFKRQFRNVAETNAQTQSYLFEILNGIETVKSQNVENKSQQKWKNFYNKYINSTFEKNITSTTFTQLSQVLQKISQLLILWFGAGMVLKGQISLGQLIAFRIISGYVTQPLLRLSTVWQNIQELKISFERLADIINTKKEIDDLEKNKILMPKINGFVNFQNVYFKFKKENDFILNGVNLSIKPNSFIGIVGQSGSGKSTLMKLLYRLYSPDDGKILIDGYDIKKVELKSLRNQIGVVPQDPLLFKGSVRENIALRDYEISEEEIIKVSKIACAHDFIMELPNGYSTLLNEKGSSLSGGQRQRITLARTLLYDPKILILDEATSSLDYSTEKKVCNSLFRNSENKTIFFVTHRLSTIKNANLIIVFHNGRIAELGTHDELIEKRGRYFALLQESKET